MPCRTEVVQIRELNYHVQHWGEGNSAKLFCLHGWMDCGASFGLIAEYLQEQYHLIAPDWRGFGKTAHSTSSYWFPDYLADLEVILNHYSAMYALEQSVNIVGHSMGGHIALLYAGIRPERVKKVVSMEGLGLLRTGPNEAPKRYRTWLDQVTQPVPKKPYNDWGEFYDSIKMMNQGLGRDKIKLLAEYWGYFDNELQQVDLRHDQKHRFINPVSYRHDDTLALWQQVTAKVAVILGQQSSFYEGYKAVGRLQEVNDYLSVKPEHIFLIEQAHHMLHIEQPSAVAEALKSFIGEAF